MTGFHGNRILQQKVDQLITCGVSSFVETGTHYAATSLHMAKRHPTLPILTCEINDLYLSTSREILKPYQNVKLSNESSEKFIDRLITEGMLGDLPMFFLDAHWHDYWPLPDEVSGIAKLPKFIILVDDFEVPGQGQFETSAGGGGTIGEHRTKPDNRPCSMALIGPLLPHDCEVAYPKYGKIEAFGNPNTPHLVGYTIVTRNVQGIDKTDQLHSWGSIK